jgi:hypothetical protein
MVAEAVPGVSRTKAMTKAIVALVNKPFNMELRNLAI